MTSATSTVDEEKIRRVTMRLAQMQAKSALRAMRAATRERVRQKREHAIRRNILGEAVIEAGFGEWSHAEVKGLLLAGRKHFGDTATARKMFAQHAHGQSQHAQTATLH